MFSQNKGMITGALVCIGVFAVVQWMFIQSNWAEADRKLQEADGVRVKWDKFYKPGDKLVPHPDAEKALNESNSKLQAHLDNLRKIEFGTLDSLRVFSVAAAGSNDPKNYLTASITQMKTRAKDSLNISVPVDLGINEKTAEDPVPLNLFRLAMVERLLTSCKESGVIAVSRITYETPKRIEQPETEEETAEDKEKDKDPRKHKKDERDEEKKPEKDPGELLVQFPMRVVVAAPERAFAQLLFEMQKPSDTTHGYFCLRGFSVWVRDSNTGLIEASMYVTALLNLKTAQKLGIPVKEPDDRHGPVQRDIDLNRGY